jgi:hypothetical protein
MVYHEQLDSLVFQYSGIYCVSTDNVLIWICEVLNVTLDVIC